MPEDAINRNPFSSFWLEMLNGDVWQSFLNTTVPITINYQNSGNPGLESRLVRNVASYGRQLGAVEEAVTVLMEVLGKNRLLDDHDARLDRFRALMARIDDMKKQEQNSQDYEISSMIRKIQKWKRDNPAAYLQVREELRKVLE